MTTKRRVNAKAAEIDTNGSGSLLLCAAAGAIVVGAIAVALTRREKSTVSDFKDSVTDYLPPPPKGIFGDHPFLLLGVIAGSILGASFLYCQQGKKDSSKGFACSLKEAGKAATKNFQNIDWAELAKDFAETVRERVNPEAEDEEIELPNPNANQERFQNVLDWAVLGLRLWNNLKR
jgi:hypothetical protein